MGVGTFLYLPGYFIVNLRKVLSGAINHIKPEVLEHYLKFFHMWSVTWIYSGSSQKIELEPQVKVTVKQISS